VGSTRALDKAAQILQATIERFACLVRHLRSASLDPLNGAPGFAFKPSATC
jgi:hypothetical protein